MTYQVLARKWRPRSFADMVGQHHVLAALRNALDTDRLHHAYLFTGTRGVGKTTLARILAKCLNCMEGVSSTPCGVCSACVSIDEGRFVDLIEVDAASRARVEETRDLMDNVQYAPSSGRYKVYLIDEVHMFSNHSFNALLKTLEEPPPHVKFLLATTEPKRLPVTILSRCLQFNLKHLTRDQIAGQLRHIVDRETVAADDASLRMIAAAANGSMRDALSLIDQAISYGSGELKEGEAREMLGTIESGDLVAMLEAVASGDAGALFEAAERMDQHSPDYEAVLGEIMAKLHDIAVCQAVGAQHVEDLSPGIADLAGRIGAEDVQLYYQIALAGRRDLQVAPEPRSGFEMTLIRMLAFRPAGPAELADAPAAAAGKKPAAAKTAAAATPAVAASGDWPAMIDEMGLNGLVREMAGHCVLKEHGADRLHLVLDPAQEHLMRTSQKDRLQKAVAESYGQGVRLLISIEEPHAETPVQQRERLEQERRRDAVESFEQDPNVREMIDAFDARVEGKSIQPR